MLFQVLLSLWSISRPSDETLNRGPDSLWSLKIPGCLSKKSRVLPRHPGQTSPLASDHHGLLIIPIHWLASSLCLLSTNKLVCGGCSGALWLPSHHPGGCCSLVVDEEIAPLLCKALWVSRKALYKCNKLYYYWSVTSWLCIDKIPEAANTKVSNQRDILYQS